MKSPRNLMLTFSCAIALLTAFPASAQQAALPVAIQQSLHSAAALNPSQMLAAVQSAVDQNPWMAQSIVNEAARYRPELTDQIVDVANKTLRGWKPTPLPGAGTVPASVANSVVITSGAGISTGTWIAGGLVVAAGGSAVALAGGGGSDTVLSPSQAEYAANYALASINAQSAYSRNATGEGIIVGVGDTGIDIDHSDLVGNIVGGYNFTSATTTDYDDGDAHGTFVSGLIAATKNNAGVHGVAYDAQLYVLRIADDNADFVPAAAMPAVMTQAASAGVDVYNGSYGYDAGVAIAPIEAELDAYETAISGGMILVFATGNDGAANPLMPAAMPYIKPANDASGLYILNTNAKDYSATASQLLAVTSVNSAGVISSFSNRCGVAAAWCLAAPGESVVSTYIGGGYASGSGTSFSAPVVSGAVALLLEKYPSLTPAQIVTRVLTSATKTGIYADTSIYGQGLLNLSSATSFQATPLIPLSTSLSGSLYSLSASEMNFSSAMGDGLSASLSNVTFKPIDSFDGAAIETSASKIVAATESSNTIDDGLRRFGRKGTTLQMDDAGNSSMRWRQVAGNAEHNAKVESRMVTRFSETTEMSAGYLDDPSQGFGLMAEGTLNDGESRAEGAFFTPYTRLASDGVNFATSTKLSSDVTARAGLFFGNREDDSSSETMGALTELAYSPYTGSSVSVQTGFVQEKSAFLGSESKGAFAMGNTTTSFAGFTAHLPVTEDIELVGSYFLGTSSLNQANGSLLKGFSDVTSDAFTIGAIRHNLAMEGDRFGFVINQPLRVSGGSASLSLPNGVSSSYVVSFSDVNASLTPTGRELDLEAFYAAPLDEQTQLNASLMYRNQPDHVKDADGEVQALVRWQRNY